MAKAQNKSKFEPGIAPLKIIEEVVRELVFKSIIFEYSSITVVDFDRGPPFPTLPEIQDFHFERIIPC